MSQWAARYRRLSPEASVLPGQWYNERTPFIVAIMDAINDPAVEQVSVMAASQIAKTELLLNVVGYFIDYDPSPMLMIQPTVEMAEAVSKDRIATMIRDSPTLAIKCGESKSRHSDSTILHKKFPGGHLTMAGANSPAGLASRPIRIILADEIDRYPPSAGREGSPLSLARKRATTFWNRKILCTSSPTFTGSSAIETEYEEGTQEQWCLPCPACNEMQPLTWELLDHDTAGMVCSACGVVSSEPEWKSREGCWIAEYPERRLERRHRSFQLSALASLFIRWSELIKEHAEAERKGTQALQVFYNTRLARSYEEKGEKLEAHELEDRVHHFDADVPRHVVMLTAGVDVQVNRLECEIVGWGAEHESWGIRYFVIPGDPTETATWDALDAELLRNYRRADGRLLPVVSAAIDSGFATQHVYDFCRPRMARNVFAVKGDKGPKADVNPARKVGKSKDTYLFMLGVDTIKSTLSSRLRQRDEGPGYCHWPSELEMSDGTLRGYASDYFKGLTAEKRVERGGVKVWLATGYRRNEPLDCRVYATAALKIAGKAYQHLCALEQVAPTPSASPSAAPRAAARRRRGSAGVAV